MGSVPDFFLSIISCIDLPLGEWKYQHACISFPGVLHPNSCLGIFLLCIDVGSGEIFIFSHICVDAGLFANGHDRYGAFDL